MSSESDPQEPLPASFAALTRVCIDCGDQVQRTYLDADGRCVGCRHRGDGDAE